MQARLTPRSYLCISPLLPIEMFPKDTSGTENPAIFTPEATLFQLRLDIPSRVAVEMEGNIVEWDITGTLPLMLMLNGLSPDDTCSILKDITVPEKTKEYWPVVVNASPESYRIFDFHIAIHTLSCFYDEQETLVEMNISLGLLHKPVKPDSSVMTHQPRYQKGPPKKRKMVSNEVRDARTMNSALLKEFSFLVYMMCSAWSRTPFSSNRQSRR